MLQAWESVLHVIRSCIGQSFKTVTSFHEQGWPHASGLTTVDLNAMPVTSDAAVSNGYLAGSLTNTTELVTPKRCTAYPNDPINSLKNNMKPTSNITKPKLQRYSQRELREIAANIEEYRRNLKEEYAWEDFEGHIHVEERMLRGVHNEHLHAMAKQLYMNGARKQKGKAGLTLQVIGQTICQEDPR
jgi:hypothetical protein